MLFDTFSAGWLFDEEYIVFVRGCIRGAKHRVLIQQFVVDARPEEDQYGEVRYLLHALAEAVYRGLDVRVLLAQVLVERPLPIDINEPSARFLITRGVPVRRYPLTLGEQMHAKVVLADEDIVIAGSHNWTPSSFHINSETSMVLRSEECVKYASQHFDLQWSKAEEYEKA